MSDGGIEVDLDNVKAIQTMPTYETKKNEKFFMQTSWSSSQATPDEVDNNWESWKSSW